MQAELPVKKTLSGTRYPDHSQLEKDGKICVTGYEIIEDKGNTMVIEYRFIEKKKGK
jgi:hypothetical protein